MSEVLIDVRPDLAAYPWTDLDTARPVELVRVGIVPARLADRVPVVMAVLADDHGYSYVAVMALSTALEAAQLLGVSR